jgi:hypothetical protein
MERVAGEEMNEHVIAHDNNQLAAAAAILHDARFLADQLTFEPLIQTFSVKCWVLASATLGPRSKRNWSGRMLMFQNVVHAEIDKSEQAEFYELATISYSKNTGVISLETQ